MPQNWASYCHLTNCSDFSRCPENVTLNGANYLNLAQSAFVVGPCLLYVVLCAVHITFLLSFHLSEIWKKIKKNNGLTPDWAAKNTHVNTVGALYKTILGSTVFLCVLHFAVLIWGGLSAVEKGWQRFVMVEVASMVQVCSWCSMSAVIVIAKARRKAGYPRILRVWWIVSFFTASLSFAARFLVWEKQEVPSLDAWVDLLALPPCFFLCVVAVHGKSGIRKPVADGVFESLLDFSSEKPSLQKKVTNYASANLFSLATLSWLDSILAAGYKKPLELDDIPELQSKDRAAFVSKLFETHWSKLTTKSLIKCLAYAHWKETLLNAFFAGLCTCASYVGPYMIDDFVEYLGGRRRFLHEGYVLTSIFFVGKLIETVAQRQWFFGAQQLGLRITAALNAVVYKKGLSLSNQSRGDHTSGEIVNYVSVDVQRISDFTWYLHELWLLVLQISLALLILYKNLGLAALATLGATSLAMLANLPLSTKLEKFQTKIMEAKDARMRTTSEVLRNMRVLKLQAWEIRYLKKIEDLRNVESRWLYRFLYTQAGVTAVFWCTPAIVGAITFTTCVLIGIPLTAGRVLSALATFRILQDPVYGIPDLIGMFAETKVSVKRIQKFLEEEEIDQGAVARSMKANEELTLAVEIQDARFKWDPRQEVLNLSVQQLHIVKGSKVAVCGQVGSGKSSLISCILGELPKLSGSVKVWGSTAYVAQTAWIQSGKVQDNILFGKQMDRQKYDQVLSVCSLIKDLELLSHGDQTEIGERGINLSGGQKQRIQLARALYQDADIYLLDDPFSAVDAHTGSHLFQKCILEFLEEKTVLYVTHQVEFLPAADNILVLEGGVIIQAGGFNDLMQSGEIFGKLIGAHSKALESVENTECERTSEESLARVDEVFVEDKAEENAIAPENSDGNKDFKALKQLVQEEEKETGRVSAKVYWSLVTAVCRGAFVPFLLLSQVLFQALQISSNYWMAWATPVNLDEPLKTSNRVLLTVYLGLAAASALCVLLRALLLAFIILKTAQKFFVRMLHSIFHAPMAFFDATPAGRILSRASTDQKAMDLQVCNRFAGLAFNIIQFIGIVVVMSQISWQIFALFIPVLGFSLWLQRYYIASARELARLVGIRSAPIIHHFSESISGVATIRGFGQESRFRETNLELIDSYCRPLFHNFAAMEWLCLRLNVLSNVVFFLTLLLAVNLPVGTFDASLAGLAVTYGLGISFLQYMVIWNLCNLENKIISVERIQQYSVIPSEAPLIVENHRPSPSWPWAGTVTLENLQVRYAPHMPMVLRGITCTFLGGQKIGVVGRTGSGKSTLIQVLFRIIEPVAGKVLIDDLDVSQVGLHDLRTKLSIIPQDPTLFEGTIRNNLDPLEEHTDAEIWKALDKSQLGDVIRAKDEKLEAPVNENGENWSVGQRQLVCLGRALLKQTRILVLDEATASVDTATDGVIQETIRAEFTDCTVITIAHRVPSVIDSDRVLFLSDGKVAEYDSPGRLLADKSSLFTRLVAEYTKRSSNAT